MFFTLNEIKNITEEKINSLKENLVTEDKHLEYKLTLPSDKYDDKKEFLSDVSSFANADSGVIFFGIKAKNGIPEDIPGLEIDNPDAEILRLENLLRTSIEPRMMGILFHPFKLANGSYLIVTHIPKSYNPPHVVNFQGHWRFYSRNSAGKYPMDINEVRNSLIISDNLANKIKDFRLERISRIISNDVFVPLVESPKIVLHLIPVISFEKGFKVDLSVYLNNFENLRPLSDRSTFQRYNLDGLLTYSTISDYKTADAYLIFYYNGIIETLNARILSMYGQGRKVFQIETIETVIINELERFINELNSIHINNPIIIMLTLLGVKGFWMESASLILYANNSIDRDNLFLPEVILNDYSEKIELIIKPILDNLWQACGFSKCRHYNDAGEWLLKI